MNEEIRNSGEEQGYSLNDDRRVKVLSPGALVAKRFFRNRLAVVGLSILVFMFLFSFLGGVISPYGEDEFFYREDVINREFAAVTENTDFRYAAVDSKVFSSPVQAQTMLAIQKGSRSFTYKDITYLLQQEGEDFYTVSLNGEVIGLACKDIVTSSVEGQKLSFDFIFAALKAYSAAEESFEAEGAPCTLHADGSISRDGAEVAYVTRYVVQAIMPDIFLSRDFKEQLISSIENGESEFTYTDASLLADTLEEGEEADTPEEATATYIIEKQQNHSGYTIRQGQVSRQYDSYSYPSRTHWLGTDRYGMDMLTRLMYGGRVSLLIGFIVVIIETTLGVILGGLAGYFGGWVDNVIMRLVDVFYCIPSTPLIIILGAMMDAMRVDPTVRLVYLMLILGFLGWAGIARLVRGQILSLREQEFMTATEACGISVRSRIFRHLVPNVIPQLIVDCTMSLGSVIITEATLSFLGLGVKFPFASWGNIINDVNNTYVLTTYWFIWIPAGTLLLLTVLAFNLVGDGLRDAFDPRMKR
ncbi:MAG: ABC transporter permease [Oscillospiraceae bacterium]|nr:ABC transporter permease [Oscillospiraceae bacterium]